MLRRVSAWLYLYNNFVETVSSNVVLASMKFFTAGLFCRLFHLAYESNQYLCVLQSVSLLSLLCLATFFTITVRY